MVYYMSVVTKLKLIFLITNSTDQDRILGTWSRYVFIEIQIFAFKIIDINELLVSQNLALQDIDAVLCTSRMR